MRIITIWVEAFIHKTISSDNIKKEVNSRSLKKDLPVQKKDQKK
ncbi:MAG: hypothetical protein ACTSPY_05115 [Candidatus Helarchaeota archaeon]